MIDSDDPLDGVSEEHMRNDTLKKMGPRAPVPFKHCEQCGIDCLACAIGAIHMNTSPPFEGYTHEMTNQVDWPAHNARGHHHVMWNGASNETIPCGSKRAAELANLQLEEKDREARREANARQVGGTHYGEKPFQHWDVVAMFKLDYFQGNITKYVFRWRDKNGLEDLEKARHYLEKYIEEVKVGRI